MIQQHLAEPANATNTASEERLPQTAQPSIGLVQVAEGPLPQQGPETCLTQPTSPVVPESIHAVEPFTSHLDGVPLRQGNGFSPTMSEFIAPESLISEPCKPEANEIYVRAKQYILTPIGIDQQVEIPDTPFDLGLIDSTELGLLNMEESSEAALPEPHRVDSQDTDCLTGLPEDDEWVIEEKSERRVCIKHGHDNLVLFEARWLSPDAFRMKNAHTRLDTRLKRYRRGTEQAHNSERVECVVDNLWEQLYRPIDLKRDERGNALFKVQWKPQWIAEGDLS